MPFFGRRYDISSIVGNNRYVSIIRRSATEIDDVYSATETTTFLWDLKTNKRVSLAGFFNDMADGGPAMVRLLAEASSGLIEKIGKPGASNVIGTLQPSLNGIGPISLAPSTADGKSSGLSFHYAVALPGRFSLKQVEVFVPWTKFKRHLSPLGRTIFGGNWRER